MNIPRRGVAALAAVVLALMLVASAWGQDGDLYLPVIMRPPPTPTATPVPPTATPTVPPPTATSVPPPPTATLPAPTPTEPGTTWDCSYDRYNCSDFATQGEAQAVFDYCWAMTGKDIHKLDFDNNGRACESLKP